MSQITANVLLPASLAAFPGIPLVVDYNDPSVENCIDPRAQWFIDSTGTQRESSATAFLNSTVMTPEGQGVNGHKLFVLFDAVAVKIVFDKHGRAKKVKYIQNGKLYEARARKAVVLAGGINSSKLLQLSGIGPSEALNNAGIKPVFINENVGKHLQNHPLIFITLQANPLSNGVPPGAPYAFTIHNVYLPVVTGGASDPRMLQILFEYIPASAQVPFPIVAMGFDLLNPVSEGSVTIQSDNSLTKSELSRTTGTMGNLPLRIEPEAKRGRLKYGLIFAKKNARTKSSGANAITQREIPQPKVAALPWFN